MNRREAVAALVGLPAVQRIVKVGDLKPTVVHVTVDVGAVSRQVADRLVRDIRRNRIGTSKLRAALGLPVPGAPV